MSGPEDSIRQEGEAARLKADQNRVEFLRTELPTSFTLADLAGTEYQASERDAAERSVAHAEEGYATVLRFMSDPKHASRISDEEQRELTAGMERLRARLDELTRL